jgi:restriction endonuclease Mrr
LAPLQDGQFLTKDKVLHKFGCWLFFFATSTTTKFSDFSLQNESRTSPKYISFQQQKGTDFVSRLGAHADDVRSRIDESPEHRVRHAIRTMSERLALEIAHDPDALMHIHDRHLEELLAEALDGIGFNVELGRGTKHGGKDIVVKDRETEKKYVIEIKHWRSGKRVNGKIISDFVKVVAREKAAKGLFVSSSGFAPDAYEVVAEIRKKNVHLGGRDKIVHLCRTFANHRSGLTVPGSELTRVLFMETY